MVSRTSRLIAVLVSAFVVLALISPTNAAGATPHDPGLNHWPLSCDRFKPSQYSRLPQKGPYGYMPDKVVALEGEHDGAKIEIGLVRPKVPPGTRVPVIVFATPYLFSSLHDVDLRNCEVRLTQFVSHGYAVAYVPVRGTADNGGCFDLMGEAERADLNQAINWLGKQSWSNGRIGMIGVSYDGSTPWEVAAAGNKYLKTIVPISGVNDIYHLMFRNGVSETRGPILLNFLYYTFGFAIYNPANGRSAQHTAEGVICPEAYQGFYASVHASETGERDPLGYWAERNSRPGVEKRYRGSILVVHGLQDWNVDPHHDFPWVNELEESGLYVDYLLGQWGHAWPDTQSQSPHVRWDWAELLLDWWDRWLKGDKNAPLPGAHVEDSSGRWRAEQTWPPPDAKSTRLYLTADAKLARKPGKQETSRLVGFDATRPGIFSYDFSRGRNDACRQCAAFELPAAERELRFAGIPELNLGVTPTGPGGHLTAHIYAVGDKTTRLGWGQVDLRFAQGGEKAKAVTPGQKIDVKLEIQPLDAVVPKDSKLVLVLSQGSYADHMPSRPPYPVLVDLGGKNSLTIDVFSRSSKAFFTPPKQPHAPN